MASYQPLNEASARSQKLIRLQIITPLSVLLALGANLVGTLAIKPGAGEISREYLTILTPKTTLIGLWWIVLCVLEIGYCLMVVMARKIETQETIINDVGLRFCYANFLMALWAIFWDLRLFQVSEVILLINMLLLLSIWATLLRHPPHKSRPLDFVFVHVPMRMFALVLWNVDIWQNGLLAFNWFKYIGTDPNQGPGRWEPDHANHAWIVFGVILAVGVIDSVIVFVTSDAVWALGTVYLFMSVIVQGGKPAQVFIPLILLSVLQLVNLLASYLWKKYGSARQGQIRLETEGEPSHVIAGGQNNFAVDGLDEP